MNWRSIPSYSRYEICDDGSVRRVVRVGNYLPGPVKQTIGKGGYPNVSITGDDGKSRKIQTHILVMRAFVGPCPNGREVCHNNGVSSDIRLSNLRYDTPASNFADKVVHGTAPLGEKHYCAQVTADQVVEIHARCAANESHITIANDYGISASAVCNIARGKSWKSLGLTKLTHVRLTLGATK